MAAFSGAPPRADVSSATLIKKTLKRLSGDLYEIVCELHGLGPYAEQEISAQSGRGVESRLHEMHEDAQALIKQLQALHARYLTAQLDSLGVTAQSESLKLHIGCGALRLQGWINMDSYPAPLSAAAFWELPFRDASVAHALISRVPESLLFPVEIREFVAEIRRVLVPDCVLQVCVPGSPSRVHQRAASIADAYQKWARQIECRTRLDYLLSSFGDEASRASARRFSSPQIDVSALLHILHEEYFTDIRHTSDFGMCQGNAAPEQAARRQYIEAPKPRR
jgi:hypothetical protein